MTPICMAVEHDAQLVRLQLAQSTRRQGIRQGVVHVRSDRWLMALGHFPDVRVNKPRLHEHALAEDARAQAMLAWSGWSA